MTAELEDQQEKANEKNTEEKLDEKIEEPEDDKKNNKKEGLEEGEEEESKTKNGGSKNDLKKAEEEVVELEDVVQETDAAQEDEDVAVVPKKRKPGFFSGLFKKSKKQEKDKDDVEAGTELLAKDNKIEIKEEDGKAQKSDENNTDDVTVPIVEDGKAGEEAGATPNGKAEAERRKAASPLWMRVSIVFVVAVLVLTAVCVFTILSYSSESSRGPMVEPLVITDCGPLRGYMEDGIYVFKGVPYAMPPTGEHRWKPPRSPSTLEECWSDTYEAVNASAYCYQKPIPNHDLEMSEDCLYLDIITPSLSPPRPRPVVVYIPGDHPLQGFTSSDIHWKPSTVLADEKDVTFVTIRYRTGVFGFLVLDILKNNVRPPTTGNYGIMDMIAALKWVKRNIRSFGGDPNKITILANGGSATTALALLASKKTESLFNQMWLTGPAARFSNDTLDDISRDNSVFLRKLNCESMECVYNKSAEEIVAATPSFWDTDWSLDLPSSDEEQSPVMTVIDGNVLYDTPFNMYDAGDIHKVPVVIGSAAQESGSSKLLPDLATWSWTDFSDYVSEKLGSINSNLTVAAIELYVRNSSTPLQQFHSMVSDIRTTCPIQHLVQHLDDALEKNVYWYLVDYKPSSPVRFSNDSAAFTVSAHGLDIAAIFGHMHRYISPLTPSDIKFQSNMQDLFYSFVYKGAPEVSQELLMSSGFINIIGGRIQSRMTPYENCHLWDREDIYPIYAKLN